MPAASIPFGEFVEINPRVQLPRGRQCAFVEMADIAPGRRYVSASSTRVAGGSGSKFLPGDTLMARITPCLENGKIAQFTGESNIPAFGSTEFWVFRAKPNVSDPAFVFYLASSRIVRGPAEQSMFGASGRQRADIDSIRDLEVPYPRLAEQRRIASILSAYDDLIENNTRRIAILEEMARRIYEEWFVNFRFPGHGHVRMVESELGPVPEGWRICRLGDVCSLMNAGNTPSRKHDEYWQAGAVDWYKTKELWDKYLFGSEEQISEAAVAARKTRVFEAGTILMAIYGSPTVGRMGITTKRSACNQAALGMRPDTSKITFWNLYYTLFALRDEFNSKAQGAAQQNISKEKVAETKFLLPPLSVQGRLAEVVLPVQELIKNLQSAITNLRTARDLLLPKLISGELDVSAKLEPEAVAA